MVAELVLETELLLTAVLQPDFEQANLCIGLSPATDRSQNSDPEAEL